MTPSTDVSIIATVLNEAEAIGELVSSLSRQSLPHVELIIVDGGSTDGTWELLQQLAISEPRLHIIRDESCNLKASAGPIARGRNRAIDRATSEVIACADAGCEYDSRWLENLTAPLRAGLAEYALGGSCIDLPQATIWDIAAAPFLGLRLRSDRAANSATARSMAFRKSVWQRVGGFPEHTFFGEDTLFDARVREIATAVAPPGAMARYRPCFNFKSAAQRLAAYAAADGTLGIRRPRFVRNLLRCIAEVAVLGALPWSVFPAVVDACLEIYFAFERDARSIFSRRFVKLIPARLLFSLSAPWIVATNYATGSITRTSRPNPQNIPIQEKKVSR